LDPDLDAEERRVARVMFGRLATALGASTPTGEAVGSPLAAIGGCLLAPRVVADLSSWANARGPRRSRNPRRLPVTLVMTSPVPVRGESALRFVPGFAPDLVRIPGEIVPLSDPHPRVLGVALTP